jgi:hypothetical protein
MKNNLSKFAFTIALALFIIPQVTFAAWWNPASWFNNWSFIHKTEVTETITNQENLDVDQDRQIPAKPSPTQIPKSVTQTKNLPATTKSSVIMDFKDVKDFDTCMNYAKNIPTNFDIVFAHGSDLQEVRKFAADFKVAYPRADLEISSEQDFLDHAVAAFGESIKTASALAEYKNGITAQATSKVSVKIPTRDLGTLQSFSSFVTSTLSKYSHVKFQQYAGSSPETTLSGASGDAMQKLFEKQCDYKYKTLNSSERSSLETKNIDAQIQTMIMSASINGHTYFSNHDSYAPGTLAMNSGICSDTGMYGLKKAVDSVRQIAGDAYCYASQKTFAFSAPLKSNPSIGYCTDSTFFNGTTTSPSAASKGYCVTPTKTVNQDITACKDKGNARERWICVGNMVDPFPLHIGSITGPFATPVSEKITFCRTYSGVEADYCFSSIVKAGWGLGDNGSPDANAVCGMVSNQTPWFKNDCLDRY